MTFADDFKTVDDITVVLQGGSLRLWAHEKASSFALQENKKQN